MARLIVVMERVDMPSDFNFRVAFRLSVPVARQPFYANASAVSAVVGATAEENTALQNGSVVERVEVVNRPNGTSVADLRARLITRHAELQAELAARNPFQFYGTNWDGTNWTNVTVA